MCEREGDHHHVDSAWKGIAELPEANSALRRERGGILLQICGRRKHQIGSPLLIGHSVAGHSGARSAELTCSINSSKSSGRTCMNDIAT